MQRNQPRLTRFFLYLELKSDALPVSCRFSAVIILNRQKMAAFAFDLSSLALINLKMTSLNKASFLSFFLIILQSSQTSLVNWVVFL